MKCECKSRIIKNGKTANGSQRYKCTSCKKQFQCSYRYKACIETISKKIVTLLREGCGIRSIARILRISTNTVQRRIIQLANCLKKPKVRFHSQYEVDELNTYVGNKTNRYWVAYALRKEDGQVVDLKVGRRTNRTLKPLFETLTISKARTIYTDKLVNYRTLIDPKIHKTKNRGTNHIERQNLTLRTHLKRLNRRTLCYSKSLTMLRACIVVYFWGQSIV